MRITTVRTRKGASTSNIGASGETSRSESKASTSPGRLLHNTPQFPLCVPTLHKGGVVLLTLPLVVAYGWFCDVEGDEVAGKSWPSLVDFGIAVGDA